MTTVVGPPGASGTPQDISGAVTSVIVAFVRQRAGDPGVAETLARAGETRPVELLEDLRSWTTHDDAIALVDAASSVTGDQQIALHIGEEMLRQHNGTDVANLLRSLGSPAELLRNVTAAAAKFSTVSSLEALEVGDAHAVVQATTRPGFLRHPHLCEFTKGLLSQVPVLFDMVPAVVTETECQARGGRFCLYSVAWEAGQWGSFVDERTSLYSMAWGEQGVVEAQSELDVDVDTRIAQLQEQLRKMAEQLEEVFSTAADLLSMEDLSELLASITRRAAGAVNAPRYILVVQTSPDEPLHLHHHGFNPEEAARMAEELWKPVPDDGGGSILIVEIASSRQRYGRLAAVYPPGMRFMERERELFSLYANYAATALDLVTSLAESRRSHATADALLNFSRALSKVAKTNEVSQTLIDTIPTVAGCEKSSVMLWEKDKGKLMLKAYSGLATEDVEATLDFGIAPEDTPVVGRLMSSRDCVVLTRDIADPFIITLMDMNETTISVMVPLYSDQEFFGMVSADFVAAPPKHPNDDRALHELLRALADQSSTAYQNAWLLEQVGHLAWHDALTGLPNRRLLEDRVNMEIERAKRTDESATMFFIDLDRFKKVNDTLGHAAGDELIRQVTGRLNDVVRRQDTVARLGGDEFAVLFPGFADVVLIRQLAERMLKSLHDPYTIEGNEVFASGSIGIATYPDHGANYDELLSHADEAMYQSKTRGRNAYTFYSGEDQPGFSPADSAQLDTDLHHAIERGEMFVLYQPYIDLESGDVVGAEALVRWRHPIRGVLEPGAFIQRAEETSIIQEIDSFVIRDAAKQMREWMAADLPDMRVSVNVSGRDLMDEGFADFVLATLAEFEIPTDRFEIEITERITSDDGGVMRATADKLKEQGVRFSIDDFGTGSSSLHQVASFPVSTLKIDQTFVQILGPTDEQNTLASAIIGVADRLGLECVAEGVETPQQSRVLMQRGCTTAQGFYFSPPLLPTDLGRMLQAATNRADAENEPATSTSL